MGQPTRLVEFARENRAGATRAEAVLWRRLRNRQLGGYKFCRQAARAGYVADFLCAEKRLIVEVDGATHGTDAERLYDERRTLILNANGYRVLRVWNREVLQELDGVLWQIRMACEDRTLEAPNGRCGQRPLSPRGRGSG